MIEAGEMRLAGMLVEEGARRVIRLCLESVSNISLGSSANGPASWASETTAAGLGGSTPPSDIMER